MLTDYYEIFPWNPNLETGIPAIDAQHKKLVALINKLAMHLSYQSSELTLDRLFHEIEDYIAHHFATEEKLIERYMGGDKLGAAHAQSHRDFAVNMARFKCARENQDTRKLCEDILAYLSHWLALHILVDDKRIARVILSVQNGASLRRAKANTGEVIPEFTETMIETILSMYGALSQRTIELMREINKRG